MVSIEVTMVLLGVALAVVFVSYRATYENVGANLCDRMGAGDWKFNESWASTLTALGGILSIVVAAQILPTGTAEERLTKGILVAFYLMFSAVIVVAVGLYNTLRFQNVDARQPPEGVPKVGETPRTTIPGANAPVTFQYQGYVICFLFASSFVLWAVLSQLLTVWHLLSAVPDFPGPVYAAFTILLLLAGALALFYAATSVPWTLRNQAYHDEIGTGSEKEQKPRVRSSFYIM